MRSSGDGSQSPRIHGGTGTTTSTSTTNNSNNNNNTGSTGNNGNSGSQYALCALGVGLVALGIVMIVWSVVPADITGSNNSNSGGHEGGGGGGGGRPERPENRNKVSSVAFVLVGSGVVMLLLSLCLGMRNRKREQQMLQEGQNLGGGAGGGATAAQGEGETAEEHAQRYAVPSYEEAVGSGQYPVRQSNLRHSSSQLPSYDDLVEVDELDGSEVPAGESRPTPPAAFTGPVTANVDPSSASNRRAGRNGRKLLPIKIRRIKSEKLHMKNVDNSQLPAGISIEPLTPPPQYDDKVPPI